MSSFIIIDDHAVVRLAVKLLLEKEGHEVVGDFSGGSEALDAIKNCSVDVLVLDIDMPHMDGFGVLQRLKASKQSFKVVIFTSLSPEQYAGRCARAGASAFVSKQDTVSELLNVIRSVLSGYILFPNVDAMSVAKSAKEEGDSELISRLSDRELSVLRLLVRGERLVDIARQIRISEKTVSTYKSRLMTKLNVTNFVELVELANRNSIT